MNNTPQQSALKFLSEIFEPEGEALTSGEIAVWNKANHSTRLAPDPNVASEIVGEPMHRNVSYFGVCTRSRVALRKRATETGKPLHSLQGERDELVAMPGVWVDLDVRAPGHKKASLAPTVDAAIEALSKAIPAPPTLMVKTGGGIHAYWLFSEGLIEFTAPGSSRSRETMEMLVRSFQAMVRDEVQSRGWSDDQTWPLPRVMRIPGGENLSHGEPRPVTWEVTGPRYSVDTLWELVPDGLQLTEAKEVHHSDERLRFEIGAISEQAVDEFIQEVCDVDEEFQQVWLRKRRNLPSQSEMDLSIATRLAAGNTPTQVIVDALRLHRIRAGVNPAKAERADYYLGVLQLALGATESDRRRAELIDRVTTMKVSASAKKDTAEGDLAIVPFESLPTAVKNEIATEALEVVNEAFGLKDDKRITRIVRETLGSGSMEDWRFFFGHIGSGVIRQVKGGQLMNCTMLRSEVLLATGELVRPFTMKPNKPRQWAPVVQSIFLAAEAVGAESEHEALISSLLRYLEKGLLSGVSSCPKPFSEPWHRAVERHERILLWSSKSGEAGALVRLDAWVESLNYDPIGPQSNKRAAWARLLSHISEGVESVASVSFVVEGSDKRRNRTGYIRIRRSFIVEHGGSGMAEQLDDVLAKAPEE